MEEDKAFVLLSASTPFEFAMAHDVIPMFGRPVYVLLYEEETGDVRICWAAFLNDKAAAVGPNDRWPFCCCIISDGVGGGMGGEDDATTRFSYAAEPSSGTAILSYVTYVIGTL